MSSSKARTTVAIGSLVASAVGLFAACGSTDAAGGGASGASTTGEATLTTSMGVGLATYPDDPAVRRTPGLVVEYAVTNGGSDPLVVHDLVPDDLGSAVLPKEVNPEHAWVFMHQDVIRVSKQGFDPTVAFIAAPVTGVRALAPGATLKGRAFVPVPIELDVPGETYAAPRTPIDAAARTWQFCVQVEKRTGQVRVSQTDPTVLESPVSPPAPGELLCSEPTELVLP